MYYLYTIKNILNNKIYIGQTISPKVRWSRHKSYVKNKKLIQYIHRAMAKHGVENFVFEVIALCRTQEDADETETVLIFQYNSRNKEFGYNLRPGGDTRGVWKQSEESKQKMRDNWYRSEESLKKLSESKKGKSISSKGKTLSLEHRKALSEAHKGIKPSKETINKIIETKKRKKLEQQLKS